MSMTVTLDEAVQRVLAIRWHYNNTRQHSHVALMREYFHRMAVWSSALQLADGEQRPFFDVAEIVLPTLRAPRAAVETVLDKLAGIRVSSLVKWPCIWYLHWTQVARQSEIHTYALPAPYEPLLRMYERGGYFRLEHNAFVQIGNVALPLQKWRKHTTCSSLGNLDDVSLDRIDAGRC